MPYFVLSTYPIALGWSFVSPLLLYILWENLSSPYRRLTLYYSTAVVIKLLLVRS